MPRPRSGIEPRIVHAARARFLAEGVDGASLRTIARDAKTSIGMVSYYFPSKDDLFLAVVEDVYANLLRDLERVLGLSAPLRDRVRRLSVRLGAMTDHELAVVRLVLREALSSSTRFRRILARFQRGHIPVVFDALARAVAEGEVTTEVPLPVLAVSVLALLGIPQVIRRVTAGEGAFPVFPSAEATARHVASVLFEGIGPPLVARRRRSRARKSIRAR
jgi:AcrR family transcriptional regulator